MRTWIRVPDVTLCGHCNQPTPKGGPMLVIAGQGWSKRRCVFCADERVPNDLPPLPEALAVPVEGRA